MFCRSSGKVVIVRVVHYSNRNCCTRTRVQSIILLAWSRGSGLVVLALSWLGSLTVKSWVTMRKIMKWSSAEADLSNGDLKSRSSGWTYYFWICTIWNGSLAAQLNSTHFYRVQQHQIKYSVLLLQDGTMIGNWWMTGGVVIKAVKYRHLSAILWGLHYNSLGWYTLWGCITL